MPEIIIINKERGIKNTSLTIAIGIRLNFGFGPQNIYWFKFQHRYESSWHHNFMKNDWFSYIRAGIVRSISLKLALPSMIVNTCISINFDSSVSLSCLIEWSLCCRRQRSLNDLLRSKPLHIRRNRTREARDTGCGASRVLCHCRRYIVSYCQFYIWTQPDS